MGQEGLRECARRRETVGEMSAKGETEAARGTGDAVGMRTDRIRSLNEWLNFIDR